MHKRQKCNHVCRKLVRRRIPITHLLTRHSSVWWLPAHLTPFIARQLDKFAKRPCCGAKRSQVSKTDQHQRSRRYRRRQKKFVTAKGSLSRQPAPLYQVLLVSTVQQNVKGSDPTPCAATQQSQNPAIEVQLTAMQDTLVTQQTPHVPTQSAQQGDDNNIMAPQCEQQWSMHPQQQAAAALSYPSQVQDVQQAAASCQRQTHKQKCRAEAERLLQKYYAMTVQQANHHQYQQQQPQGELQLSWEQQQQQQHQHAVLHNKVVQPCLRDSNSSGWAQAQVPSEPAQQQQQQQQQATRAQQQTQQVLHVPLHQQMQEQLHQRQPPHRHHHHQQQQQQACSKPSSDIGMQQCRTPVAEAAGVSNDNAPTDVVDENAADGKPAVPPTPTAAAVTGRSSSVAADSASSDSDVIILDDDSDDEQDRQQSAAPPAAATPGSNSSSSHASATQQQQQQQPSAAEIAAALSAAVSLAVLDPRPASLSSAQGVTWAQIQGQLMQHQQNHQQQQQQQQCVARLQQGPVVLEMMLSDFNRLRGSTWLNDEVVNFYLAIVQARTNKILRQQQCIRAALHQQPQQQQQQQRQQTAATVNALIQQLAHMSLPGPSVCQSNSPQQQQQQVSMQQLNPKQQRLLSVPSSYIFSSFFYQLLAHSGPVKGYNYNAVRRWTLTNKTRTAECVLERDLLLFPINLGNTHWAVAAVWPQKGLVQYYDSLNGSGSSIMNNLARWLVDDAADKKVQLPWLQTRNADGQQQPKQQQQQQQWQGQQQQPQRQQHKRQQQRRQQQPWLQQLRCEAVRAGMPQQADGSSCGVFACTVCERLSAGFSSPFRFSQADVPRIRRGMAVDIIRAEMM